MQQKASETPLKRIQQLQSLILILRKQKQASSSPGISLPLPWFRRPFQDHPKDNKENHPDKVDPIRAIPALKELEDTYKLHIVD